MRKHLAGFTFIELIIFIVVIGLVASTIFISLQTSLELSPTANYQTTATEYAQERMELILAQRFINGYSFTDPCTGGTPPAICTLSTGYTITTAAIGATTPTKTITVTATGPNSVTATLTALVGNY